MRLIETTEDELPVFSPEARMVVEFNRILMRDGSKEGDKNGRKKEIATRELAFVHFWCVFDSRYNLYDSNEQKMERIRDDVGLPSDWYPDKIIEEAIYKYTDLLTTRSSRLVEKADATVKKLETFFDELDLNERTTSGALVLKPADIQKFIAEMPNTIKAIQEAEKLVRKELEEQSGKKVNKDVGMFEGKDFKVDYTKPI